MRHEVKTPVLQDLYSQRHMYDQHRKKLGQIRAQRKSHLGFDNSRTSQFENIKESKNKTFINKFNKLNDNIAKQNLKLLGKLQSVKPSLRHSVSEERERSSFSYITPFVKKRMMETQKQNVRISNRMKNMSSSLNQKHFVKDFSKSQQIKNRIMKYAIDESKVYLKSQRYLADDNKSVLSRSSNKNISQAKQRRSVASHYNKEDIMRNKVEGDLVKGKRRKFRPNTSQNDEDRNDQGNFFTTQPKRQKVNRRKIYV